MDLCFTKKRYFHYW